MCPGTSTVGGRCRTVERAVGQADDGEVGDAGGGVGLDPDDVGVDPGDGGGESKSEHRPAFTTARFSGKGIILKDRARRATHASRMRKMLIGSTVSALVAAMLLTVPAFADDMQKQEHDEATSGGPWHFRSVPCAQGTVTAVHPRLGMPNQTRFTHEDFVQSGVVVEYALPTGTMYLPGIRQNAAAVVHYQNEPDNALMESQRRGDQVQVCLVSFPTPRYDAQEHRFVCDPDADPRGWQYRVYSYRLRAAYVGPSSQHACGGA
jgi:hypothetical protein